MVNFKKITLTIGASFFLLLHFVQAQDTKTPHDENPQEDKSKEDNKRDSMEIYGFAMLDEGYNFNQIDPSWFDVDRPTKLPSFKNQYGTNGNAYFSVRQTRFGVKNYFNTPLGQLKTIFEFEMFGTGVDTGQTTLRLRHAYGEIGHWGAGQYWSPFMDIDIFPNTLEYWGPNGMAFFRNVQIRYTAIHNDKTHIAFAFERPGASADQGRYSNRVELKGIAPRFPLPDLSGEYRHCGKFGYVELAGILRRIEWKDMNSDSINLSGGVWGWGLNLSTNLKLGKKDVFKGQVVYGKGIQNYMNDAPVDIGIKNNFSNPAKPVLGVALPVLGVVAFLDHSWSKRFTSSIGYSLVNINNSNGQADNAFHRGQYAIVNLLYNPTDNVMAGIEYQWGKRSNFKDGWDTTLNKIQVSFKYKFSYMLYKVRK